MMQPHRSRFRLSSIVASAFLPALLLACTKPNPRDCTDGTCTDSAFPFCDVGGEVSGAPQTCIAVECTAGEFKACHGDTALTSNAAATDYDTVRCEHGCDDTFGCRLCEANQSVCIDGKTQTCDASGQVIASQTCPLGCFEDQPRCRDIDPSNGLAKYLDMGTARDLMLSDGDVLYTDSSMLYHADGSKEKVPTFSIPPSTGGSSITVIVADHVQIHGKVIVGIEQDLPAPALAIIANDEVSIDGGLSFYSNGVADSPHGGTTAGGVTFTECMGGIGKSTGRFNGLELACAGSGGGGHATSGGRGGNIRDPDGQFDLLVGGNGGTASGNATLIPLRGGCAGGKDSFDFGQASGGGAIQISSRIKIALHDNSSINVNGYSGISTGGGGPNHGGGAGGGILLEAPEVSIGDRAYLLANGGSGYITGYSPLTSRTADVTLGVTCTTQGAYHCSNAGNGASASGPATDGGDVPYPGEEVNGVNFFNAGGGGGGLGFIRINTKTGVYTKANTTVESGIVTTGTLSSR